MSYLRRISVADAVDAGYPGYQVVMVAGSESATVLAGFPANGEHPPLHTREVDLFYVVLEGSATVRLGRRWSGPDRRTRGRLRAGRTTASLS